MYVCIYVCMYVWMDGPWLRPACELRSTTDSFEVVKQDFLLHSVHADMFSPILLWRTPFLYRSLGRFAKT